MDLFTKISESLADRGLTVISESRLRAAVITMKRGTVIKADHARIIKHPVTHSLILVFGQQPGDYETWHGNRAQIMKSLTSTMRDFTGTGYYIPTETPRYGAAKPGQNRPAPQDETGWCEPDEDGQYDAHRDFMRQKKFKVIMTANMENVASINWHIN
jgi:hypothetical protein